MTDLGVEIIKLSLFETRAVVPLRTLSPGTYTQRLLTQGNSILSTVFVESIDVGASISVRYFDFTTGELALEQYDLGTHTTITTAPNWNRILIPRIHDKPVVEITIAGGNVRFGVYVSVISSFASDLDQALQLDGALADLLAHKGMPVMTYDELQGKFFFLRGDNGVIPVSVSEAGDALALSAQTISTPGTEQTLITSTVPAGKVYKLSMAIVTCRQRAEYVIDIDGAIIGSGRTGASNLKDLFPWSPRRSVAAGETVSLKFTAASDTVPSNVEAYLMGSELDV